MAVKYATEIEHGPTHSSFDCPLAPEQMVLTCLAAGQWSAPERQKKDGKPSPLLSFKEAGPDFPKAMLRTWCSISIPGSQDEGLKTKAALWHSVSLFATWVAWPKLAHCTLT